MQQQLQAQIRKNKQLLQSNFTLMQQNQLCLSALTRLHHYVHSLTPGTQEKQNGQEQEDVNICADDAQSITTTLINVINQKLVASSGADTTRNMNNKTDNNNKGCQCQKWKQLYMRESQQSYRLSKRVNQLQENINKIQARHELQVREMDIMLRQYLGLYRRVHSVQFIQGHGKEVVVNTSSNNVNNGSNSNNNSNKVDKTSREKQRRSTSKTKSTKSKKPLTSPKLPQQPLQPNPTSTTNTQQPPELPQLPLINTYLEHIRQQCNNYQLQNKILREELSQAQMLIRVYRVKERERVLYGEYLVS